MKNSEIIKEIDKIASDIKKEIENEDYVEMKGKCEDLCDKYEELLKLDGNKHNPERSKIVKEIDKLAWGIQDDIKNNRSKKMKTKCNIIHEKRKKLSELDGDGLLAFPDTSLPFFAYGVFKPGEISYPRIASFVEDVIDFDENGNGIFVPYKLCERDGIPTVFEENKGRTYGSIIKFFDKDKEEAYDIIRKVESKTFYKWSNPPLDINGEPVNMLFGKKHDHSRPEPGGDSYNGVNDAFFKDVIPLIINDLEREYNKDDLLLNMDQLLLDNETVLKAKFGKFLDENKQIIDNYEEIKRVINKEKDDNITKRYFKLQRDYLLLWTAIERYTSLKYGENPTKNNSSLAEEQIFIDSLKLFVKKEYDEEKRRKVFSSDDLKPHYLDPDDAKNAIVYYYTMRSNVVHRGKGHMGGVDENDLRKSLLELLTIFQFILKDTFKNYRIKDINFLVNGIKVNEKTWQNFKQSSSSK